MTPRADSLVRRVGDAVRAIVEVLMQTYESWRADRAIRLGAALAYNAVFAAVPLASSVGAIAGILFAESEIREFLEARLDTAASDWIREAVNEIAGTIDAPATVGSLTILGLAAGVFAASLLFVALQDSFNMIWNVPVQRGLRNTLRRRLTAFAVVALLGALLAAALIVQTVAVVIDELFLSNVGITDVVDELLVTLAMWGLGVLTLAILFQLLTRSRLAWRNVFVAASVTAVLLVLGTWALGLYFRYFGSVSVAGVTGSILIVLIWLYYEAQILIGGAELLKTLDDRSMVAK